MKESKKNIPFALISLALNHLISMNNSRTKLLNYALHSFQFFVLKEDENITTSAWQKFLRFLAFMKIAIDLPNRKTLDIEGWILKKDPKGRSTDEREQRISKECFTVVCVYHQHREWWCTKSLKKRGSKSWEACQKFDFLRGLKYLEDIVSVFTVEILHLKYTGFFYLIISDMCIPFLDLEIRNR